jgi:hypothetical protein
LQRGYAVEIHNPALLPTVLKLDSHIVMPGTCPGIHAVQPLRLKMGGSVPFSARRAPLDGMDARTGAGHDSDQVDENNV